MKKLLLLLIVISCSTRPPITSEVSDVVLPAPEEKSLDQVAPVVSGEFHTALKTAWVLKTVEIANCVKKNPKLYEEIRKSSFTHTGGKTNDEIAQDVASMKVGLRTYRNSPFSIYETIATTYPSDKQFIHLNTRYNPRAYPVMINTSFHEGLHLVGYSHGDNKPQGKENSVNFKVGKIAETLAPECMGGI